MSVDPARRDDAAVTAVRAALAAGANPERAVQQQRYMRSALPYWGWRSGDMRAALRPVFAAHPLPDADAWRATVAALWEGATHREELYAAIGLWRYPRYREWAREPHPASVALLRRMVASGAWWDVVDEIAAHCVGDLLRAAPDALTPILRGWARDAHLWVRRTAILSQLRSRADTNLDLLVWAIRGSWDDPDFFARKAIGWALREYSKTDAAWVRTFVADHAERLSPLSRREALAWLDGRGAAGASRRQPPRG